MHTKNHRENNGESGQAPFKLNIVCSMPANFSERWPARTLFSSFSKGPFPDTEVGTGTRFAHFAHKMAVHHMGRADAARTWHSYEENHVGGALIDVTQTPAEQRHILMLAANADLALIGIDVQSGTPVQAFEDIARASFANINHLVVLIADPEGTEAVERYAGMAKSIREHCDDLDFQSVTCIAISAQETGSAQNPAWYDGDGFAASLGKIARLSAQNHKEKAGSAEAEPARRSDQLAVHLFGASEKPVMPGRSYTLLCNGQSVNASISTLKHNINLQTLEHLACRRIHAGEIAYGNLSLDAPVSFRAFDEDHQRGGCLLIDKISGEPVALVAIRFDLWRSSNVHWQQLDIDKKARSAMKQQNPAVLWFTGLSGSGKSTIANLLEKKLYAMGKHTCLLDGDNVRHGLCRDLGFTEADRVENIRRIAETAKLMSDAGLLVITSFISPFRSERRMARQLIGEAEFVEIFVNTSLEVCEQRDTKGLYKKARAGLIKNFTGLDSPYEIPERHDICLDGAADELEPLVDQVIEDLSRRKLI